MWELVSPWIQVGTSEAPAFSEDATDPPTNTFRFTKQAAAAQSAAAAQTPPLTPSVAISQAAQHPLTSKPTDADDTPCSHRAIFRPTPTPNPTPTPHHPDTNQAAAAQSAAAAQTQPGRPSVAISQAAQHPLTSKPTDADDTPCSHRAIFRPTPTPNPTPTPHHPDTNQAAAAQSAAAAQTQPGRPSVAISQAAQHSLASAPPEADDTPSGQRTENLNAHGCGARPFG